MSELTQLEGMKVEAGAGILTTVIYEVAEVERVENAGGVGHRVHLQIVEDSTGKRPEEMTHMAPEFRDKVDEGHYEWV